MQPITLPFGRHKGQPLSSVPATYLRWALRECKLSSGIRAAVSAELQSRGVEAQAAAPPGPAPACRWCPDAAVVYGWLEDRLGRRHVRAACGRCGAGLGFVPAVPPYSTAADLAAATAPVLDVLLAAAAAGVGLESDGRAADFKAGDFRKATPELRAKLRQCRHQLGKLMGDTARDGVGQADITAPALPSPHPCPRETQP